MMETMMEKQQLIGRVLSANSMECVLSALVTQRAIPAFGSMLRIPCPESGIEIYGVVTNITLEEDGFLRRIAGNTELPEEVIRDARENRNIPIVLRVAFIGYVEGDRVLHLLPPRPPVTLTEIYPCTPRDLCAFTKKLGYLRLLLTVKEVPPAELLAVHIREASRAHAQEGDPDWAQQALDELMDLLNGNSSLLISVMGAIGDTDIFG